MQQLDKIYYQNPPFEVDDRSKISSKKLFIDGKKEIRVIVKSIQQIRYCIRPTADSFKIQYSKINIIHDDILYDNAVAKYHNNDI